MEIRQCEYLVTIAKHKSFTKAAEELRVAQPALSYAIKNLEAELGLVLFKRGKRQVHLTLEGEEVASHARIILKHANEARQLAFNFQSLTKGTVSLGLPSMTGSYLFPPFFRSFKEKYPGIQFELTEAGTETIQDLIAKEQLDMGLIVLQEEVDPSLETFPLTDIEMVAVTSLTEPLLPPTSIEASHLLEMPIILFKEGYYQRTLLQQLEKQAGKKAAIAFETDQISMAKQLVKERLGVTLFLDIVVDEKEELLSVNLEPKVTLKLALAKKKEKTMTRANQAFLEFVASSNY
ncbi:LysR family transcriptional regulator [Salsuginibacillus kocurii]|uniref:LysR family transcriptional regulator n=1 Tax=Salsuginibacillus kocurii TaxID=427078 RepID=UPI00036DCA92|nr:LysR family transcriptional regulator [Salsuginibacillus kocurii]